MACTTWEQCQQPGNPCGSECAAMSPAPTPTATSAPTRSPTQSIITDCRGEEMESDDYRLKTWLGDDFCDKTSNGDFDCRAFGYDCCDCIPWWQECDPSQYTVCQDGRRRRQTSVENHVQATRALATTTVKTTACADCSVGEYCPPGTSESARAWCPTGFYCPDPSTKIECPSNYVCNGNSAYPCIQGEWCPAGATKKVECPPGFYCREPQVSREGSFWVSIAYF